MTMIANVSKVGYHRKAQNYVTPVLPEVIFYTAKMQLKGGNMARALTTRRVETLKPNPEKRLEIPDPALSGLYIIVQPSGAKSWALRYRYASKPKKLTLGRWPMMTLSQARTAATEAIEQVEMGIDPSMAKKAAKAAKMEIQLSERDTVKVLVEQFDKRHLSKLKSGAEARRFLERFPV
jgi:hypothetical protein